MSGTPSPITQTSRANPAAQFSGWLAWDDASVSLEEQVITKYYYAGGQRVAVRKDGELSYLLSETMYKPCPFRVLREGETRYSGGAVMPTDRLYTGQIVEPILGLYFYNARWYDSSLSRFAQADTIVPLSSQGVQAWDRYAGMNNNPIMYTDPSGHWMCGDAYDSGCAENSNEYNRYRAATNRDIARQDHIFSLIFSGSNNGTWTNTDWDYYYTNRDEIWGGQLKWMNNLEDPSGLAGFSIHVQRLSLHYSSEDKTLFVQDFGLFWGGIPSNADWTKSAIQVVHGPVLSHFYESNDGMDSRYIDSINSDESQAHHYAGLFFLGYFAGSGIAGMVNFGRDGVNLAILDLQVNLGDVYLGDVAASDGMHFALTGQPNDLSMMISNLSNYQGFVEYGAQYRPR